MTKHVNLIGELEKKAITQAQDKETKKNAVAVALKTTHVYAFTKCDMTNAALEIFIKASKIVYADSLTAVHLGRKKAYYLIKNVH